MRQYTGDLFLTFRGKAMQLFIVRIFLVTIATSLLFGCSSEQSPSYGNASFSLQWDNPATSLGKSVGALASDICTDYGVDTIKATFIDGAGATRASGSWSCSSHQGTVTGIPAASNYKVVMEGLITTTAVGWRGELTGVDIRGNTTNSIGTITMVYIGGGAPTAPAQVLQTGQITCTDVNGAVISCTGTGQDGEAQKGVTWPISRFVNNGNGTVSDMLTGLIWTQDANLMAARSPAFDADGITQRGDVYWQHALDYVNKLNAENYGGHNDWRLPNINELKSLVNLGQTSKASWLNGQGFSNVKSLGYWSSTRYGSWHAYYVNMDTGSVLEEISDSGYSEYVWPVSSGGIGVMPVAKTGQTACYTDGGTSISCSGTGHDGDLQSGTAWPVPRFVDNGNQTVTDKLTGLIWSKDANPAAGSKTWQQALDYINTLNGQNYRGYSDWRLPNRNELESLVNRSQTNPATWLGTQSFVNVQSLYWSNDFYSANSAWLMKMSDGTMDTGYKSWSDNVWPVRGGI